MSNLAKSESDLLSIMLSRNIIELTQNIDKIDEKEKTLLEERLKSRLRSELNWLLENSEIKQAVINSILKYELDWGIRDQIWPRIQNSLRKFQEFCFSNKEEIEKIWGDPRKDLFKLISDGKYWVTTPAMLVVEAILYSHQEWARPFYHDIWSAGQTHADILRRMTRIDTQRRGVPQKFIDKIVTMISFQNLFRNGLLESKEVGVWHENTCVIEIDQVRKALAREIFRLWRATELENKKIALSAIAACSLSHEGRISSGQTFLDKCKAFKELYDCIDNDWSSDEENILYYFEYANYMFIRAENARSKQQQRKEFKEFSEEALRNILIQANDKRPSMIFLSFGRFWSNREIDNFYRDRKKFTNSFEPEKGPQLKTLRKALLDLDSKTSFAHLKIEPEKSFELFFGEIPPCLAESIIRSEPEKTGIWVWIESALKWIQKRRPWRFDGMNYTKWY